MGFTHQDEELEESLSDASAWLSWIREDVARAALDIPLFALEVFASNGSHDFFGFQMVRYPWIALLVKVKWDTLPQPLNFSRPPTQTSWRMP